MSRTRNCNKQNNMTSLKGGLSSSAAQHETEEKRMRFDVSTNLTPRRSARLQAKFKEDKTQNAMKERTSKLTKEHALNANNSKRGRKPKSNGNTLSDVNENKLNANTDQKPTKKLINKQEKLPNIKDLKPSTLVQNVKSEEVESSLERMEGKHLKSPNKPRVTRAVAKKSNDDDSNEFEDVGKVLNRNVKSRSKKNKEKDELLSFLSTVSSIQPMNKEIEMPIIISQENESSIERSISMPTFNIFDLTESVVNFLKINSNHSLDDKFKYFDSNFNSDSQPFTSIFQFGSFESISDLQLIFIKLVINRMKGQISDGNFAKIETRLVLKIHKSDFTLDDLFVAFYYTILNIVNYHCKWEELPWINRDEPIRRQLIDRLKSQHDQSWALLFKLTLSVARNIKTNFTVSTISEYSPPTMFLFTIIASQFWYMKHYFNQWDVIGNIDEFNYSLSSLSTLANYILTTASIDGGSITDLNNLIYDLLIQPLPSTKESLNQSSSIMSWESSLKIIVVLVQIVPIRGEYEMMPQIFHIAYKIISFHCSMISPTDNSIAIEKVSSWKDIHIQMKSQSKWATLIPKSVIHLFNIFVETVYKFLFGTTWRFSSLPNSYKSIFKQIEAIADYFRDIPCNDSFQILSKCCSIKQFIKSMIC